MKIVTTYLLAAVIILAGLTTACGGNELSKAKHFSQAATIALAQAPAVIDTLLAAHSITHADADFYNLLFGGINADAQAANQQIQALTTSSTNRDAVIIALQTAINTLTDALNQINNQHPNARFAAALIIVRGFATAALGYLQSQTFSVRIDRRELERLQRLMDPKAAAGLRAVAA